jgi:hypothetical protein
VCVRVWLNGLKVSRSERGGMGCVAA